MPTTATLERARETDFTVFASGPARSCKLSVSLPSHETRAILFFSSSLCGGGLALRPPALRCKPPSLRSLQLTAVQFWQSLEHGVVQMWFVAVCGTCHGVFCWLTIPNGPAHSQMRSFMGIVSFFWRQTRDSGLAASELEIFSHKFAFGAVCVKQSSICIGLEAAT